MGVSYVTELKWVIRRRWIETINTRKYINKLFISYHGYFLANCVHCVVYRVEIFDGDFPILSPLWSGLAAMVTHNSSSTGSFSIDGGT